MNAVRRTLTLLSAVVMVCIATTAAVAQLRTTPDTRTAPTQDPQRLQQPQRAPITITPSLTITEEYNDNVLLDNRNRQWDLITGFTPAIAAILEQPTYRLGAAYSFTAEVFARDPGRNHAFDRQNFNLDAQWRPTERWSFGLSDVFTFDTNTNLISPEGVSTGRNRSWSNTLTPNASYRLSELTTLRGFGSYSVLRFSGADLDDSDIYRAEVAVDRLLTRQLTATLEYQFSYFDIQNEGKTLVHTPRIGGQYQLSPTITVSLLGGPSFEQKQNDGDRVTPSVTASYRQRFAWGSIGLSYDRAIGTAGGLGGTTDNQSVGGTAEWTTLMKGLIVTLAPRYTTAESPDDRIDQNAFSVALAATYRITSWMAALASYTFYRQRVDATILDRNGQPLAVDADQNRVWVGLTFGYPIRFD